MKHHLFLGASILMITAVPGFAGDRQQRENQKHPSMDQRSSEQRREKDKEQGQDWQRDRDQSQNRDRDSDQDGQQDQGQGRDRDKDHDQSQKKDDDKGHDYPGQQDGKKPNIERFNVVCYYTNYDNPEGFRACRAASVFDKVVTPDGGEVADNSPEASDDNRWAESQSPALGVQCEKAINFNDHARRFTGLLSTRIQALTGPHPALWLPRGSLHAGVHTSESVLEIDHKDKQLRLNGQCYIWTGRP